MKVVHVNYDGAGWGGASIAALRIHEREKSNGNESIIVCRTRAEHPDSIELPIPAYARMRGLMQKIAMKLAYGHVFRSGLINTGMASFVNSLKPDKVVLHWLHIDTIGLEEIPRLNGQLEWWLHDLWPMSGVEPYPKTDWYVRGDLKRENLVGRASWKRKREVVKAINDRLIVKGPSRWVCDEARKSVVFCNSRVVCESYPLSSLYESQKAKGSVRRGMGGKFVMLFGAVNGTANPVKGFDRAEAALSFLPDAIRDDMELRIFGQSGEEKKINGVRATFLGSLGEKELCREYESADVFLFPSRYETWGQVKSEALSCGCPVIAFNETACPEGIQHKKNGWIASDVRDFAAGIVYFYQAKSNRSKVTAR